MNTDKRILEVIACSVEDAVEAERGGATRLEVISRFDLGGLTPPLALVRDIRARVRLPVRVMLRESESFEVADAGERHRLCRLAGEFAAASKVWCWASCAAARLTRNSLGASSRKRQICERPSTGHLKSCQNRSLPSKR
jgi:hypothetical protein